MKKANLQEAKLHLSKLIDLAASGEEIIICRAGHPIAKLVSFKPKKGVRKSGAWAGKVKISKDFDQLPDDFLRYFK